MIRKTPILFYSLTIAVLIVSLVLEAQQNGKLPRVGVTMAGSAPHPFAEALHQGLTELGWVDGQNILIEYRYAEGKTERYPVMMAELIGLNVDVIVSGGGARAARPAMRLTETIPIVVPAMGDPIAAGLVTNLARPDGNVTGQSFMYSEIGAKRVELLYQMLPKLKRLAILQDPSAPPSANSTRIAEAAARSLGLQPQVFSTRRVEEFDDTFDAISATGAEALMVLGSSFFYAHRQRLVDLAAQHRLVTTYEHRGFVDAGGLMSYGANIAAMYHSSARYIDKLLKGAKPAELPIEQAKRFDLVIDLRVAKALGLAIPPEILFQATEVIQ